MPLKEKIYFTATFNIRVVLREFKCGGSKSLPGWFGAFIWIILLGSHFACFWEGVEDFKYDLGHASNKNAIWAIWPIWIGIFHRGPSKPELSIKDDIYEHRK